MTWVAVAVVGAGVAGSLISANTQAGAQQAATDAQNNRFNTIQGNSQQYMQAGGKASDTLSQLMGMSGTPGTQVNGTGLNQGYLSQTFNPTQDQLNAYPGYQFQLQTGGQALTNAQTPQAGALSGSTLKSLMGFNQGMAASNYQNYFNQFQTQQNNIFNRLNSVAGLGQSAAAGVGNSGTQLGIGAAQSTAAAGASTAAGTVGAANAIGQGAVLSGLMSGTNNNSTAVDSTGTNLFANSSGGNIPPSYSTSGG